MVATGPVRSRILAVVAIAGASAAGLAGCGQGSKTPLPDLTPPTRPTLSEAEQAQAIRDLASKGASANADAAGAFELQR